MIKCVNCSTSDVRTLLYPEGRIFLCNDCGLQWANRDLTANGFVPSYNSYYLSPSSFGDAAEYPPYEEFFSSLEKIFSDKKLEILDIGSGSGIFVQQCVRRGYDAYGVEADSTLRSHLPADIEGRMYYGLAEELDYDGKRFDVVTFWDSFEHIESSFEILEKLKRVLNEDGVVFLRVNNNVDVYNYCARFLLRFFPSLGEKIQKKCFTFPDHCWNFSQRSMVEMLSTRGWGIFRHFITETPASRLTNNLFFATAIRLAYLINRVIGGGKIGTYYIRKQI